MKIQVVRPNKIYAEENDCFEIEGLFSGATISDTLIVIYLKEDKTSR